MTRGAHQDHLIRWAAKAEAELQSLADDTERSGSDAAHIRALLAELDAIRAGRPVWQFALPGDTPVSINL